MSLVKVYNTDNKSVICVSQLEIIPTMVTQTKFVLIYFMVYNES